MITFDLSCENGHRFEGWFRNHEDCEEQFARGLVACPLCGATEVRRCPSAPAVHVARRTAPAAPPPQPQPEGTPAVRPEAFFRAVARVLDENFEDVGARFADEARQIDRGAKEARNIRGTTTAAEEQALRDEVIEFFHVALPKYDA